MYFVEMNSLVRILTCLTLIVQQVQGQCDAATLPLEVPITSTPTYITSENYPSSYAINSDCAWIMYSADNTSRIIINILDVYVESCYDKIMLYDNADGSGTEIAKICSQGRGSDEFISTGIYFYLKFSSDYAIQYKGFRILAFIADGTYQIDCGSILYATSTEQFIMSNTLPDAYPANYNCSYIIYPTTLYYGINITMYFMDIEETPGCTADKLSISGYANDVLTEVFAGCTLAATYEFDIPDITGEYAVVNFTSNNANEYLGYYFSYTEVFKGMNITYPAIDDPDNAVVVTVIEGQSSGTNVNTALAFINVSYTGDLDVNITDATTGEAVPFTLSVHIAAPDAMYYLRYSSQLDYDNGDTYFDIAVSLTSTDVPQLTSTVYFTIIIEGIDDNEPIMGNLPSTATVYRTAKAGYEVFTVNITDDDVDVGNKNNFSIVATTDTYNIMSISDTGLITLVADMDTLPITTTSYSIQIQAEGDLLRSTGWLSLTVPPDSPPECTLQSVETQPLDSKEDGVDTYVDYVEEWSCTDDNDVIVYSIGSVTPPLSDPLFGIEEDTGELYLLRAFSQAEAGASRKFVVETLATDSQPQSTTIIVTMNVTAFNCYPNPQYVYVRMDYEPGTVVATDFNCSTNINIFFVITKQYPSNTFEMQNNVNVSYALILKEKVYKIRFYSLYMTASDGQDYVPLKLDVVIQTVLCSPDDVS